MSSTSSSLANAPEGPTAHDGRHILVTGATGFIGRQLVKRLLARGNQPLVFARDRGKARALFGERMQVVTSLAAIAANERIDAIVNLAGEPIAGGLWTQRRRALLIASRLDVTRQLLTLVDRLETKPPTWINASAIGYYGARGDEPLTESAAPGTGFQSELCRQWEAAANEATTRGIAVTLARFGVVLGHDGGALPQLARPVRMFAGTVLGSGRQWFSWIHLDDLLALLLFLIDQRTVAGALNATAPEPVRYDEFMATLATALHRPLWPLHVPAAPLRFLLGELAELFVDGQRVLPARAQSLGFEFRYPEIAGALAAAI
jgi:uncharacterized protein (TIGR01777 family)